MKERRYIAAVLVTLGALAQAKAGEVKNPNSTILKHSASATATATATGNPSRDAMLASVGYPVYESYWSTATGQIAVILEENCLAPTPAELLQLVNFAKNHELASKWVSGDEKTGYVYESDPQGGVSADGISQGEAIRHLQPEDVVDVRADYDLIMNLLMMRGCTFGEHAGIAHKAFLQLANPAKGIDPALDPQMHDCVSQYDNAILQAYEAGELDQLPVPALTE